MEKVRPALTVSVAMDTGPGLPGRVKWAVTLTGSRSSAAPDMARAAIAIMYPPLAFSNMSQPGWMAPVQITSSTRWTAVAASKLI